MKSTRLKNGTFRFTMTDSEYSELQSEDPGFCIQCGGETFGVEPDARCYECDECGERSAYGMEELLIMGRISITLKGNIMAPQEITLDRTGDRPATFRGEMVTSFKSGNATAADREASAKQWFVIDLYQTVSGTYVAHIQYRAGRKLGRELPKNVVISDKVLLSLFDTIKMIDAAADFVTPRNAISQRAELADAARWHETSCRYARKEFTDVVNKLSHYVTKIGGAEEIL